MAFNTTVGNSSLLSCHVAKYKKIKELTKGNEKSAENYLSKLVGYYGDVSHSHAQKAFVLNNIPHQRELPYLYDQQERNFKFDIKKLILTIKKDIENDLIPFFIFGVLGSTPAGSNDDLDALADVCENYGIYLMIDAAYAGSFFICKEFQKYQKGLERANSYCINPAKTLLTGMDAAIIAIEDANLVRESFELKDGNLGSSYSKLGESTKIGKRNFIFKGV